MIITLTTDFGLSDAFVGVMKGVILGIAPEAQIIDITHTIASYDVMEAAIIIQDACRYFPSGTIHVVVVDPGVGSARRPLAVEALVGGGRQIFIGPDNGVFSLVPGIDMTRRITNAGMFYHPVSSTFHGRDIFAPVAAHLAAGIPLEAVGPAVSDRMELVASQNPTVLRVDKFGNLITNLHRATLGVDFVIRVKGAEVRKLCSHYAEAVPGEVFAIEGSSGLIELSVHQGSAAEQLNLRRGMEFEVETGTLNP